MKPLESYARLQDITLDEEYLLRGIMLSLSVRDFADLNSNPSARALKKSSVDAAFIERANERLREFENRRFDDSRFVGLFVDGKYLAGEQIVIALGVTEQGFKIPLGFIQTSTENSLSISQLFRSLQNRGFSSEGGLYRFDNNFVILQNKTNNFYSIDSLYVPYRLRFCNYRRC